MSEANAENPSKKGNRKVSAVMTVYNERENIGRFFESFLDQTYKVEEIPFVIVDAGSTDGTTEIIEGYREDLPNLELIVSETNRSEGRNLAIEKTSGKFILTFNADVVLEKDTVENLIKAIENKSEVGGIAAMQRRPENQSPFAEYVYNIPGMAQVSQVTTPELSERDFAETHSIPCECGIWRREALPEGLFNENLNWGEDTEFHSRMMEDGWKIYGTRKARFEHFYAQDVGQFWNQQIGYGKGASILWKTVGKLESWGLSWKMFIPIFAPFALVAWLFLLFVNIWVGLGLFVVGTIPILAPSIQTTTREKNVKFLPGVFFVLTLKYIANFFGFWKALLFSG